MRKDFEKIVRIDGDLVKNRLFKLAMLSEMTRNAAAAERICIKWIKNSGGRNDFSAADGGGFENNT